MSQPLCMFFLGDQELGKKLGSHSQSRPHTLPDHAPPLMLCHWGSLCNCGHVGYRHVRHSGFSADDSHAGGKQSSAGELLLHNPLYSCAWLNSFSVFAQLRVQLSAPVANISTCIKQVAVKSWTQGAANTLCWPEWCTRQSRLFHCTVALLDVQE